MDLTATDDEQENEQLERRERLKRRRCDGRAYATTRPRDGRSWGDVGLASVAVGTGLAAASANTWNQVWERELDKLMPRTAARPLRRPRVASRRFATLSSFIAMPAA